jgi:dTDP-4-dehydrorhamnose reductase
VPNVDSLRRDLIEKALLTFSPNIVINPAAYTAVDRAKSEPALAFAINRDGARIVASAAASLGVPILHLSTDYVFDGKKKPLHRDGYGWTRDRLRTFKDLRRSMPWQPPTSAT